MSTPDYDGEHQHPGLRQSIEVLAAALMNTASKDHTHQELVDALGAAILGLAPKDHSHPTEAHEPQLDNAVVVAAADWPWPSGAHFVCDGVGDEEQFRLAHDALPTFGGKIVATGGTFRPTDQVSITKDNVNLTGFGASTIFIPDAAFPPDKYVISCYKDETRPLARAQLSNFAIRGHGVNYANTVHGVEFVSFRGHMDHIWINMLPGTGLRVRNVAGGPGNTDGWNCYESTYSHLNIGNNNIGVDANSTDQHWSDVQIYSNAEANLKGSFTGTMFNNAHLYGGAENRRNQQTIVNVDLYSCSRMSFEGGKIEHAFRELVRLNNTGHVRFVDVGFRNASGEGDGLHPQIRVSRLAPSGVWGLIIVGCRFDADAHKPSWNILIEPDALRGGIIDSSRFANGVEGSVTPFGSRIGVRTTLNGLGWNEVDPNVGGGWKDSGEWGLQVIAGDTGKKWEARSKSLWVLSN